MTASPDRQGGVSPLLRAADALTLLVTLTGKLIAVACLSVMFVALLVNVVLRYGFSGGIAWAYEIHALLLPWLVAGGVVVAAAQGANIAVTLLPGVLGPRVARALLALVQVLILVIAVSVLVSSQPILRASQFQTLSTLGIRQIWGYASLIFAFGGMAVIAALDLIRVLAGTLTWDRDAGRNSLS